jgi:hypothetical protein
VRAANANAPRKIQRRDPTVGIALAVPVDEQIAWTRIPSR